MFQFYIFEKRLFNQNADCHTKHFFSEKIKGKYTPEFIDTVIEKISLNPKASKNIGTSKNLYLYKLGICNNKKYEYNLVYFFENRNTPIYFINIFKNKEKDIINKAIFYLACDAMK